MGQIDLDAPSGARPESSPSELAVSDSPTVKPELQTIAVSKVFAVAAGNALEFYDFLTFSFFAVQIGHSFFPASRTSHGLLYSLAAFGVGFLMRPIGSVVIGFYGDRAGRKPAMILSFTLMGVAILGVALTPSFAQIGIAAPILLVIFRLTQGFALGGEVGPTTAFLVEAAPVHRRGLYVSIQYMTQDMAVLGAGVVGFLLSKELSPQALDAWGWRLAFLVGTAVVPLGLYMRHSLPETMQEADRRAAVTARHHVPVRLVVLALMMMMSVSTYLFGLDYITTYVQDSLHMPVGMAFGATVVVGIFAVIADPLSGLLSDRVGRKPVMIGAGALLLIIVIPAYLAMNRIGGTGVVFGMIAILALLQAPFTVPALVTITEALPKPVRSGALAVLYALAVSTFGGSTQFVIKWLTDITGSSLVPAWYISGALVIGLIAMVLVEETAPVIQRPAGRA